MSDGPPELPEGEVVVRSPWNVRLMATWDEGQARLSIDEGQTWQPIFENAASDGWHAQALLTDLAFDCHGRLFGIWSGGHLAVLDTTQSVGEFDSTTIPALRDESMLELLVSESEVVVLSSDPAREDSLALSRADPNGRWRTEGLWADPERGWDGLFVQRVRRLGGRRFRLELSGYTGGECGHEEYYELTVAIGALFGSRSTVRARNLGEYPGWN